MTVTTRPGDQFDRSTSEARTAAETGPVTVTEGGKPAPALPPVAEHRRLTGGHRRLGEMLAMPGSNDVEFDPPRLDDLGLRPAEFD